MNYQQKLEKQNKQLREKLSEVSLKAEKYLYCEEVIDKRLKLINKKILDLYNTNDSNLINYKKNIEACYEDERDYLLGLRRDLEKMKCYG
jgi:hypothetical protein